jgi:hypothetical protein
VRPPGASDRRPALAPATLALSIVPFTRWSCPHADVPIYARAPNPDDPHGWGKVAVRAASLKMHDMWTPRGVGIKHNQFPMNLGCDGAGVLEDGREAVIHLIVGDPEMLGPRRTLLTEQHQGTFADYVVVPPAPGGVASALIWLGGAACLRVGSRAGRRRSASWRPSPVRTRRSSPARFFSMVEGDTRGKIVFPV